MSWSGVLRPTNADAVALFFAGDNPDERAPLKLKWAFASKGYLQSGSGTHTYANTPQHLFSPPSSPLPAT